MNRTTSSKYVLITGLSVLLGACGGGNTSSLSSSPSTSATPASFGSATVNMTDAPGDFSHVWITVTKIAFHSSASQTWSVSDSSWQTYTLPTPVTLDLASLDNGALNKVFSSIQLPTGTYRQIRLFLDGPASALDGSAQAIADSNGNALQWNDQVERVENGQSVEYALNVPFAAAGVRLTGTFNIVANSTLNLTVDVNLNKSVVAYHHGKARGYILNPWLRYYDMSQVGAITGSVDPTQLCLVTNHQPVASNSCAYNIVVKAEAVDSTQGRYASLRTTMVDPTTGSFTLYPVAVNDINGNPIDYHVLVRGRNMETMVIKHVPVTAGTTPTQGATTLPKLSLTTLAQTGYSALFASPLTPLTSGYAVFMQTDPIEKVPYSVRFRSTDPATGNFFDPVALENSGLLTTTYATSGLVFAPVVPKEGSGNYSVGVNDYGDYLMSTNFTTLTAPTSGSSATFGFTAPTQGSNSANGTITGTIALGSGVANKYNHLMLYVADASHVVTSQDLSTQLSSSTIYTQSGLSTGNPWDVYYVYLRLWNDTTKAWGEMVPVNGVANLNQQSSAMLNVSVNQ